MLVAAEARGPWRMAAGGGDVDYVSRLNTWCQKNGHGIPVYSDGESMHLNLGPWTVAVTVRVGPTIVVEEGGGKTIKDAKKEAARKALEALMGEQQQAAAKPFTPFDDMVDVVASTQTSNRAHGYAHVGAGASAGTVTAASATASELDALARAKGLIVQPEESWVIERVSVRDKAGNVKLAVTGKGRTKAEAEEDAAKKLLAEVTQLP